MRACSRDRGLCYGAGHIRALFLDRIDDCILKYRKSGGSSHSKQVFINGLGGFLTASKIADGRDM